MCCVFLEGEALVMSFGFLQEAWFLLIYSPRAHWVLILFLLYVNGGGLCVCVVGVMCCDLLAIVWCDFN